MDIENEDTSTDNPSLRTADRHDVFFIYSERERNVEDIADHLAANGITSHIFRRDIPVGEEFQEVETARLRAASVVVVLLGETGWGPTHREMTSEAQALQKKLLPVLIGDPPPIALEEVDGLFTKKRYVDLRARDTDKLDLLVREVRRHLPSPRFGRIIAMLVDGDELDRAAQLDEIIASQSLDKPGLAARLRTEIETNFAPGAEKQFAIASRDPKRISSIRSWMLSALIWTDPFAKESELVIVKHASSAEEPDRNVRFWLIAGAHQRRLPYLNQIVTIGMDTADPEVNLLARCIEKPADPKLLDELRTRLGDPEFETVWSVLRVLRVVAIPEIAPQVCAQLDRLATGKPLAYDVLFALSHPKMAEAAIPILLQDPGLTGVIERMIEVSRGAQGNYLQAFADLLSHFPDPVGRLLDNPDWNYEDREIARALRIRLPHSNRQGPRELYVAGYASDTINVGHDDLGIAEDVETLAAVMLAREVNPPLAIGLFGDWGTGKSFFMQSIRNVAEELATRERDKPNSRFHSNVAQIEFNAWHYVDANLWASLVSHILERLAAIVTPAPDVAVQAKALITELESARLLLSEAELEKGRAEDQIQAAQDELQELRLQRENKKIELRNLQAADLHKLFSADEATTAELNEALAQIGAPEVYGTLSRLSEAAAEARTLKGRSGALLHSILHNTNRWTVLALVAASLLVPVLFISLREQLRDGLAVAGSVIAELIVLVGGGLKLLGDAIQRMRPALTKIETIKKRVDDLIAEKKSIPTAQETELQGEIFALESRQQQAESRLTAAATRVVQLEERVTAIKDANNLGRFLSERTTSDDYRRHLGLISTIRRDFDALASRLASGRAAADGTSKPVERIILYIDDLDRCPPRMVIDVLQAVHLLLAYDLFVVVVGVDPRWLLRSLQDSYSPFQSNSDSGRSELWSTTPQNYLEKIFQIPFSLRPMGPEGYTKLVERLMAPASNRREIREDSEEAADAPMVEKSLSPTKSTSQRTESLGKQKPKDAEPSGEPSLAAFQAPMESEAAPFSINEDALSISATEMRFAERLFPFIPTPRAAKRFVNVYRLAKAPLRREDLQRFEGSGPRPGEFQVPMLLLAILIGAPAQAAKIFPKLLANAKDGEDVVSMLSDLKSLGVEAAESNALQAALRSTITDESFPRSPDLFVTWLPRIARFSFESGRAIYSRDG